MEVPGCAPSIKPKVEPRQENKVPPLAPPFEASDDDWEVTPLSGDKPYFTSIMCKSQVQVPFQQGIPVRFHRHLPEVRAAPAVLLCRGRSWTVTYCGVGKWRRLQGAWKDFARDNGLRIGDACVFELIAPTTASAGTTEAEAAIAPQGKETDSSSDEQVVFRVQVLRGGLPEEIMSRGATADDPLVILD